MAKKSSSLNQFRRLLIVEVKGGQFFIEGRARCTTRPARRARGFRRAPTITDLPSRPFDLTRPRLLFLLAPLALPEAASRARPQLTACHEKRPAGVRAAARDEREAPREGCFRWGVAPGRMGGDPCPPLRRGTAASLYRGGAQGHAHGRGVYAGTRHGETGRRG